MQMMTTNQKTSSMRARSFDATGGSQVTSSATAVAMPPATMPSPISERMEPLRIRCVSLDETLAASTFDPQPKPRLLRYGMDTPRFTREHEKGDVHGFWSRHFSCGRRRGPRLRGDGQRQRREHPHDRLDSVDRGDHRRCAFDDLLVVVGRPRLLERLAGARPPSRTTRR